MLKLIYCITKKPGLTDDEFFDYWKNIHGPIGARIPRLRRLVQSHRRTLPGDTHRPDYDGMAELWFDSAALKGPLFHGDIDIGDFSRRLFSRAVIAAEDLRFSA
jgi:uncharacterized protein (TIGR02118 family)